jgi:hypothetical protein
MKTQSTAFKTFVHGLARGVCVLLRFRLENRDVDLAATDIVKLHTVG